MGKQFIEMGVVMMLIGGIVGCGTAQDSGVSSSAQRPAANSSSQSTSVAFQTYGQEANSSVRIGNVVDDSSMNGNVAIGNTSVSKSNDSGQASTENASNQGSNINPASAGVAEIFSVPPGEVALTIDDGPSPYTEQIVSVLNEYHVKATFFFIGNNVLRFPDAVRMAVASGDEIGDHTVDHPQLTKLSKLMQQEEINGAIEDIKLYDPSPVVLFRPPYELMNTDTLSILAKNHMSLALWNRDPQDWAAKTPNQITSAVLDGNPSGGVFDLHDKLLTMEALPAILKGLAAYHLQVVVLPQPVQ